MTTLFIIKQNQVYAGEIYVCQGKDKTSCFLVQLRQSFVVHFPKNVNRVYGTFKGRTGLFKAAKKADGTQEFAK